MKSITELKLERMEFLNDKMMDFTQLERIETMLSILVGMAYEDDIRANREDK